MQQRQQPDDLTLAIDEHMVEQDVSAQQAQNSGDNLTISSLGEYILPFFVAVMEACWLNAALIGLAGLDFLQSSSAFMPFWGPPLLLVITLVLFRRATQKEAAGEGTESERSLFATPGLSLMFGVLAVLTVFLIWLHLYSATFSLFDPNWILACGGDILSLGDKFFQVVMIIAIAGFCAWRGMKLAQFEVKAKNLARYIWSPEQIFRQIWIGLLVFLGAILVRARLAGSGSADDAVLILSIPIFLYCSLAAHSLARVVFIRSEHPYGLEGSVAAQERSLLSVISGVGTILGLLTIIGSMFFSSTFFSSIQPVWQALAAAYDWLASLLAQFITWILTPAFYIFNAWFYHKIGNAYGNNSSQKTQHSLPVPKPHTSAPAIISIAAEILIPLLILLGLWLLLRLALRHRKRLRVSLNRKTGDVHESIWSWQLFWTQLKAFWAGLFSRLFPARAAEEEQAQIAEEINASPAARTIREIYRALLKKAAQRGHARKRDETPHEFRRRLNEHEAHNEPQLGMLTDAYALTRYGGGAPSEHELGIVRHLWNELEQKWEASS